MLKLAIADEASEEFLDALRFYMANASAETAARFRDEFDGACRLLLSNPAIGSLRFAHLMEEAELRAWTLRRFPFRVLYVEDGQFLRVLAVEHERREPVSPLSRLRR